MNMNVIDYTITCSQCGKKLAVVSLAYFGVPHNSGLSEGCCMECLPTQLDKIESEGYNPDVIKRIRDWMNE